MGTPNIITTTTTITTNNHNCELSQKNWVSMLDEEHGAGDRWLEREDSTLAALESRFRVKAARKWSSAFLPARAPKWASPAFRRAFK
jgi:hypothetical protein